MEGSKFTAVILCDQCSLRDLWQGKASYGEHSRRQWWIARQPRQALTVNLASQQPGVLYCHGLIVGRAAYLKTTCFYGIGGCLNGKAACGLHGWGEPRSGTRTL
jgi:hypothetical protein